MIHMVEDTTLCSIRQLVDYLHDEEERHYSECDESERKNHIYNDVLTVKKWLDSESDIPVEICPKCGKKALEVHGEGITSNGRHYPIEDCTNCGFAPADFSEYSGTVRANQKLQDTKDVVIKGKGFQFEADIDEDGKAITTIRLTEFGKDPDEIEMLETYDFELGELVTKKCTECGKILSRGTEKDADRLIIYCTESAGKD